MTQRVELLPFYCPIEATVPTNVNEFEARAMAWSTAMGLCPNDEDRARLKGTNAALWIASSLPDGIEDRIDILVQWFHWAVVFDDGMTVDKGAASFARKDFVRKAAQTLRTIETLDVRLCRDDPSLLAIHDLAVRHHERATAVQSRRWIEGMRMWIFGTIQQMSCRAVGATFDVDDYLASRIGDSGAAPVLALCEFANGPEIPGSEMDSPPVRAVTEATAMVGACDNDRVSRYKELGEAQGYNIIDVLQRAHGSRVEEATAEAVALRDRAMGLFLALSEALVPNASPALRAYLTTLRCMLRINVDWSLTLPRYTTTVDLAGGRVTNRVEFSTRIVDEPADNRSDPPPYPAIAWWWDELARERTRPTIRRDGARRSIETTGEPSEVSLVDT